jgi:matrixin
MDRSKGRALRTFVAASSALAALHAPITAHAFCRTTTAQLPAGYDPNEGCYTAGNVLWWRNACVGYSIQQSASRQVTLDQAEQAIATAFAKWTSTACPADDAGQSRVSIDVRDEGPVACDSVQYNQNQPNQHVIIFRDDVWPYDDANNTLALTTVTFDPDTGELYDADMEINSTSAVALTVSGPVPPTGYDFESIVTHETGHFLGMAHTPDSRATMYARYVEGSISMRDLAEDDVSGICTAYPPDGTRTTSVGSAVPDDTCDPTPRHGFSTECTQPQSGCAARESPSATAPGSLAAFAIAGVIGCALTRRRRKT